MYDQRLWTQSERSLWEDLSSLTEACHLYQRSQLWRSWNTLCQVKRRVPPQCLASATWCSRASTGDLGTKAHPLRKNKCKCWLWAECLGLNKARFCKIYFLVFNVSSISNKRIHPCSYSICVKHCAYTYIHTLPLCSMDFAPSFPRSRWWKDKGEQNWHVDRTP